MSDNISPSDTDITNELASIVLRVSELIHLATTGLYNSRSPKKIAKRLWDLNKHNEAEEFVMLIARAEELRPASSGSS